jgi:hypothetical protein
MLFQQGSDKTIAALCWRGMSAYFVSGNGGWEYPLISSKIAGTLVLRGFPGSHRLAPTDFSPLISPWVSELLHSN